MATTEAHPPLSHPDGASGIGVYVKGILRWPLSLQPKEKRTFEIQYQIEYPPTLVLELNREKAQRPSPTPTPTSASPAPSRAAPSAYDLKQDIQHLEEAF